MRANVTKENIPHPPARRLRQGLFCDVLLEGCSPVERYLPPLPPLVQLLWRMWSLLPLLANIGSRRTPPRPATPGRCAGRSAQVRLILAPGAVNGRSGPA